MRDEINLRQVTSKDKELLFMWANDPALRNQSINQNEITMDQHSRWLYQRLNDSNTKMWILEKDGIPVGQIRWDLKGEEAMLDYSISAALRGRGLGKEILKKCINELRKIWTGIILMAEVKEKNIASIKAITAAGFKQSNSLQSGYLLFKLKLE